MIDEIRSNRRWKIYALCIGATGLCAFLAWMVFYQEEPAEVLQTHAPPIYNPPLSLEERILEADVIARVRFRSVSASAEVFDPTSIGDGRTDNFYVGALEYQFDVLEYLKGSGGGRLVAIVHGFDTLGEHKAKAKAAVQGEAFLAARDTRWDDREAIVFLANDLVITSTQQSGRYWLGATDGTRDGYTISSGYAKRWLPAASAGGASGTSGSGGQRFLTDEPPGGSSEGVSGDSGQAPSMSLAELKTRIGAMESLVNAGDGSDEYRECLIAKYEWERDIQHYNYVDQRYDYNFESGLPADRWVYEDWRTLNTREHFAANPQAPRPEYWLEGRDKDLFYVEHPGVVFAKRPLPEGEYKMYYQVRGHKFIVCDAYPESERTRDEYVVQVTSPDGTVHEAFFDPVSIGATVGVKGTNGVLEPSSFTFGSAGDVRIERIEWEANRLEIEFAPHNRLAEHHIDFIALDGSVSLRLDFDDALEIGEGADRALSWNVCEQPWEDGDLLMLRLSESPENLLGATNNASCLGDAATTPTPTATATPDPQ